MSWTAFSPAPAWFSPDSRAALLKKARMGKAGSSENVVGQGFKVTVFGFELDGGVNEFVEVVEAVLVVAFFGFGSVRSGRCL